METFFAAAGLIAVGALTPGPNNLIVLRAGAEGGWRGALPAMAGILAGGLALLLTVVAGASQLFRADPRLGMALGLAGCLTLAAYGVSAVCKTLGSAAPVRGPAPKRTLNSFASLFLFQFLNPKSWLLVVSAAATLGVGRNPVVALGQLGALFLLIPAVSLAVWCSAGAMVMHHLERPLVRVWFERLTGGLLIGFALILLKGGFDAF